MPLREYLAGLAFFLPTLLACAAAGVIVVRLRYRHLRGSTAAVAIGLWVTLILLAAHLIPLALTVLSREAVFATAFVLLLAASLVPAAAAGAERAPAPSGPVSRLSKGLATIGLFAVSLYVLARLWNESATPFTHVDVASFHLPGIARWMQSGSLWQIDQLFPFHVTGNYPNNGDVLTMSTVLPWRDVAFAHFAQIPFLSLAGLTVYALARELRASWPTAALAAAVLVALPAASNYAISGLPDAIALAGFGAGVLFLVRHARSKRTSELVLAGLGLGLALGTKWYGLTIVAAVFAVWVVAGLWSRRPWRSVARQGLALIGLIGLVGGIWLVRNLLESGNPIFPQEVGAFGVTLFDGTTNAAVDRVGFSVAHYLGDLGVLTGDVIPALWDQLGVAAPVVLAGVLLAVGLAIGRRRAGDGAATDPIADSAILALAAAVALITVFWAITPGSAPGYEGQPVVDITVRWLVPAPLLGVAVVAALSTRLGRWAGAVDVALLIAVAHSVLLADNRPPGRTVAEALVMLLVAGAGVAAAIWLAPRWRALGMRSRVAGAVAAVAAVAVLALGVGVAARIDQVRFHESGYAALDPSFAWIESRAPSSARIGIAGESSLDGVSPILPAFGPRLANEVAYVGPWKDELLRQYRRRSAFVAAVLRGDYDLLLIGRGVIPKPRAPEERWAEAAGYRLLTGGRRLALYGQPADG